MFTFNNNNDVLGIKLNESILIIKEYNNIKKQSTAWKSTEAAIIQAQMYSYFLVFTPPSKGMVCVCVFWY